VDRVFLDANILFSVGYREHSPALSLWDLPDVQLITSAYAVEEARRNLDTAVQRVRLIERVAAMEQVATPLDWADVRVIGLAEKDLPIMSAAIAASATHLLTADLRHFKHLYNTTASGVLVMHPRDYLHLKRSANES
jgi:hypothetical protein